MVPLGEQELLTLPVFSGKTVLKMMVVGTNNIQEEFADTKGVIRISESKKNK
jgi:hypothetical protein